jgi:uncharacterized lipoprotein YddW (UPF0748 family)
MHLKRSLSLKYFSLILLTLLLTSLYIPDNKAGDKRYFLWLDGHSNFERLATPEGITDILDKAKTAGFTDIIAEIRGTDGYVLYPSKVAPVLDKFGGFKRSKEYDYPKYVIAEAKKRGLRIYLALNVFSEGNKMATFGMAYKEHPEWQVQVYTKDGIVPITESNEEIAAFVNPLLPEVRNHIFSIFDEVLHKYNPDGVVLDRARYPNISGDFSQVSKEAFEKYIGEKVKNFPEDIYKIEAKADGGINRVPGPWYKKWLVWRTKNIHDFFVELKGRIKAINPKYDFTVYVGSWYPYYWDMGVNWASKKYHPEKEYDWADPSYNTTGFAEVVDLMFTGNYYYDITEKESYETQNQSVVEAGEKPVNSWWYSVQGASRLVKEVTCGAVPFFGSLYVEQYKEKNNPRQFVKAMKQCINDSEGLMIFDVCHLEDYDWWKYAEEAIKNK